MEKHYDNVLFLVYVDYTFFQEATPRVRCLGPFGYDINVEDITCRIYR